MKIEDNITNVNNNDVIETETKILPKESKGGDHSRKRTSLLIALIFLPMIILASLSPSVFFDIDFFGFVSKIYIIIFQLLLIFFIYLAIKEIALFIELVDNDGRDRTTFLFILLLSTFGIIFVIFSFDTLYSLLSNSTLFLFNINNSSLIIFGSIIYFSIVSFSSVKLKDALISYVIILLFYNFLSMLTTAIYSWGWQVVILIITIASISDIMSYVGGKKYGKNKIFPKVSPNKTREGTIIGYFSTIIFSSIFFLLFFTIGDNNLGLNNSSFHKSYWMLAIIPISAIFAPLGDIFFSRIKREYNKKDFSNLLPGHGGIFDRLDSHIFVMIISSTLIEMIILR